MICKILFISHQIWNDDEVAYDEVALRVARWPAPKLLATENYETVTYDLANSVPLVCRLGVAFEM